MERKDLFADGMSKIHYAGGMIRCDFMTYQPVGDGKNPESRDDFRLVLPVQGFLRLFDSAQALLDRMEKAGIVKKNPVQTHPESFHAPGEKLDN